MGVGIVKPKYIFYFLFILGEYVLTICRYMLLWVHVREETTNYLGRKVMSCFITARLDADVATLVCRALNVEFSELTFETVLTNDWYEIKMIQGSKNDLDKVFKYADGIREGMMIAEKINNKKLLTS